MHMPNLKMNNTKAEDSQIIGTLLVIAVIYCLVEVVRYWQRRRNVHPYIYEEAPFIKGNNSFKLPPPDEDCPICFLTLPTLETGKKYKSCCGKIICSGCIHAVQMMDGDAKCPFCRVPTPTSNEEIIEMTRKRVEMDDANGIYNLGCSYYHGKHGMPQDRAKAFDLWHLAAGLGCAAANNHLGYAYDRGNGVEHDMTNAKHFYELAAIGGMKKEGTTLAALRREQAT